MSTLENAIELAARAHAGQVDKAGQPYILHPLRVMMRMTEEADRIVAVLHDVLEDCPDWTAGRLWGGERFSTEIVDALLALTRNDGETYEAFIERCGRNPIARRVKLADLADNMDPRRIARPTGKDRLRHEKYERAVAVLQAS